MTGGRSSILQIAATTLIISYILYHHAIGWGYVLSWKYIRIAFICLVVGLPVFYLALPLVGRSTDKSLFDYISAYMAGSIQHFNQYIQNPSPDAVVFGEESLVSLQSFFGNLGFPTTTVSATLNTVRSIIICMGTYTRFSKASA